MAYKLFWMNTDGDTVIYSSRELLGQYKDMDQMRREVARLIKSKKFKGKRGAFIRNEIGTSIYMAV